MPGFAAVEQAALEFFGGVGGVERKAGAGLEGLQARAGDDQAAAAAVGVAEGAADVVELRMQGDAEVGRQGPGGGGPDDQRSVFQAGRRGVQREGDVDRRRGLFLVLDLGFGERGLGAVAPEHGALAAVDQALLDEGREGAHDVGLVLRGQREVGVLPVAEHAQALEGLLLDLDKVQGELLGAAADFGRCQVLGFLDHLELDRQAVAVPARDVGGVEAGHGLRLHDQVLEHLVEGGAHVDVAVGEGRAVVQDEARPALGLRLDAPVQLAGFPFCQPLRLARDQVRLHREVGLRQQDGILVVLGGGRLGAHGIGRGARRLMQAGAEGKG